MANRLTWKIVREAIHQQILDGTLMAGDKLPRDEDIARDMGCARSTVQRAMQDLSDSGILERRRKGGTRVRAEPVTRATLDIPVIRNEVENSGRKYGYHLIRREVATPPPSVLAGLGLGSSARLLRVEALHLADNRPFVFEDRWVSIDTVPEIMDIDLSRENANEWLVHNRPWSRCDLRVYAEKADVRIAEVMEIPVGEALLVIDRTTWAGLKPITTVGATTAPGYQLLTQI